MKMGGRVEEWTETVIENLSAEMTDLIVRFRLSGRSGIILIAIMLAAPNPQPTASWLSALVLPRLQPLSDTR